MSSRRLFLGGVASVAAATALVPLTRIARAAPRRTPSRIKTRDAVELYVKDWGPETGRPVVFTHGWPFTADSWDHHASVLAEAGYRVITYDKRGFGRSTQPWTGYDFDSFADDMASVIQATGVNNPTLVGYSMGGGEIVRYMSRHGSKHRVSKVVLIATIVPGLLKSKANPDGIPGSVFDDIKAGIVKDRPTYMAGVIKDVIYDAGAKNTIPVTKEVLDWSLHMAMQAGIRGLLACVDAFGRTDFRSELRAVNVPTLILHGTNDKPVPFGITARVAAAGIAKAKLIEYKGASHGVLVTERDRVTRDLLEFLNS